MLSLFSSYRIHSIQKKTFILFFLSWCKPMREQSLLLSIVKKIEAQATVNYPKQKLETSATVRDYSYNYFDFLKKWWIFNCWSNVKLFCVTTFPFQKFKGTIKHSNPCICSLTSPYFGFLMSSVFLANVAT